MSDSKQSANKKSWEAFYLHEVPVQRANYRTCCIVAMIFMPAGSCLELLLQDEAKFWQFLPVRLLSSAALAVIWLLLGRVRDARKIKILGLSVSLPPIAAIAWMIHETGAGDSTYYAGLNLVMAGAALLMRWSLPDSIVVFGFTVIAYMIACLAPSRPLTDGIFLSNLYFIFVTGTMMIVGTWLYNRIRFNEFQLYQQIEESNHKLREMDEIKSRFFANISHELRTPLTLLIAPVEAMLHQNHQLPESARHEMLVTMQANAMRLLKLINNLLDLVRMESGTLTVKKTPLALHDFIMGLTNACSAVAKDKHISLSATCDESISHIMADTEKLERICLNLLFNALKFTPAGGIVVFSAELDGEWLCLDVRDTGVGISTEQMPHLFSRFWQADPSSQRKYQGMGIGLALVKELVTIQGGTTSAVSKLGKGTTISVRLPYEPVLELPADVDANPDSAETDRDWITDLFSRAEHFHSLPSLQNRLPLADKIHSVSNQRGKKPVLIIAEDEPEMLRFLHTQMADQFQIIEAVDGQQAIVKAAQFLPDIILCDMMMPIKDGLQVCTELRSRTPTRNIPILLLTARADEKTKIDCLTAGATDFVGKPFSLTELKVRLKNLVESHLNERELASQKNRLEATLEQLKETEALLVHNEKLSSLGRMSAGLIHEINNPLNYAVQGLHLIRQSMKEVPAEMRGDVHEILEDVETGVNRVVSIISDLRGFTRTEERTHGDFLLDPLVDTVLRFFSHDLKDGIVVEKKIDQAITLHGNHGQITQVLVNLVQNAIDAIQEKTYPAEEHPLLAISAVLENSKVKITIKDNGIGMSSDTHSKVFDPFFTTKEVGKGMGLGLSICHRIVADHGGMIMIDSKEGVGTEFTLDLPDAHSYHQPSTDPSIK